MRRDWTILRDRREKRPLIFPTTMAIWNPDSPPTDPVGMTVRLCVQRVTLPTGDYLLRGYESCTIIERKGNLDELAGNLQTSQGRRRFIAELERLRNECMDPVLLLEGDPVSLQRTRREDTDPPLVRDMLLHVLAEYEVRLFLLPCQTVAHRRAAAEWAVSLLLTGAVRHGATRTVEGGVPVRRTPV